MSFVGSYDPRACGAKCDMCPLQGSLVIKPDMRPGATEVLVASAPDRDDAEHGRLLVSAAGMEVDAALDLAGRTRAQVSLNAVVLCRPPKDDLKKITERVRRARKNGDMSQLTPVEACTPRLLREIYDYHRVIPMGAEAVNAVAPKLDPRKQKELKIMKVRGTFIEVPEEGQLHEGACLEDRLRWRQGRRVMPILDPKAIRFRQRWRPVFQADMARAFRWFEDRVGWQEPEMLFRPSVEQVRFYLTKGTWNWELEPGKFQAAHLADIETDGIETQTANIRCLGIGGPGWAVVIPFLSVDGKTRFYNERDERAIWEMVAQWCENQSILKIGHNFGVFDKQTLIATMQRMLGRTVSIVPILDTIQLARMCFPELDRGLKFLGSFLLDVIAWAEEKGGLDIKRDEDLWTYNGRDVAVNGRLLLKLWERFCQRNAQVMQHHGPQYNQFNLLILDHHMQEGCVGMERQGMFIDQKRRGEHYGKQRAKMLLWANRAMQALDETGVSLSDVVKRSKTVKQRAADMNEVLNKMSETDAADYLGLSEEERNEGWTLAMPEELGLSADFNPGSAHQLRAVLFGEDMWDLPLPSDMQEKELYTASGDISTSDAVLRRLLMNRSIPKSQRKFVQAVRMYRRAAKLLGTYILPVRPLTGDAKADEGCVLYLDGRVHPNWKNHGPVTGRFASAGPNAQNWPAILKDMIIAGPGHVLVGADMDQLELRVAAARWKAKAYLEAFAAGTDAHQVTMRSVFPDEFDELEGWPSEFGRKDFVKGSPFDKMRKLAKTVQYLSQYGGSLEALYRTLTAAEDKQGKLIYAHLTLQDAARLQNNWKQGCQEFPAGWESEMAMFQMHGYLIEPVTGRRRDFTDGGKLNEVVNFPIQASGAGIMNKIMRQLMEDVGFGRWGDGTGIINQCHDSITLELPKDKAQWGYDLLMERMNVDEDAYPTVRFTAEADIGIKKGDPESRWSYT
jgi:uracil-DNA glycosylase